MKENSTKTPWTADPSRPNRCSGINKLLVFIILLFLLPSLHGEPRFGGEFKFSKYYYMFKERWQISKDTYHLLDLYYDNQIENIDFKMRGQVRLWDHVSAASSRDLATLGSLLTYEIIPWETWVRIKDIPVRNLNLKIGKQYFQWGTADGIHPSSVLNPDDYTDPFALNEKIPVTGVNLNYFLSSLKIHLIWIPTFTPVKMPRFFPLFEYGLSGPGMEIVNLTETMIMPPELPDGAGKAAKLDFSMLDIDLSAGYFHGYDYMPAALSLVFTLTGNMINQFDLKSELVFPKLDLYTFDFTTSIEGFGFWCEAGIYDYSKTTTMKKMTGQPDTEIPGLDGKPYISYILGIDYTFPAGFYFNLQYAFGLPYLRGKDNLEDYFILALKDTFFNGTVEVALGNMFGFKRALNMEKNHELMITPELKIIPLDDLIIGLRWMIIEAKGLSMLFTGWKEYDSMGFYTSYTF